MDTPLERVVLVGVAFGLLGESLVFEEARANEHVDNLKLKVWEKLVLPQKHTASRKYAHVIKHPCLFKI